MQQTFPTTARDRADNRRIEAAAQLAMTERPHEPDARSFANYLRCGMGGLTAYDKEQMLAALEKRAQSAGTDSAGGYTVPTGFAERFVLALDTNSAVREVATVIPTITGADLPLPTADDTGNTGARVAENAQHTDATNPTYAATVFESFAYSSKLIRVSLQLASDSGFDIAGHVADWAGRRVARALNTDLTVGDGSSKPRGLTAAATSSGIAPSDAAGVTLANLIAIKKTLAPAYRKRAKWMFNENTLAEVESISGLPERSLRYLEDGTPLLLGHRVALNDAMPDPSNGNVAILYGDFSEYIIRDVAGVSIVRLVETVAELLQVGFLVFSRHDGDLPAGAAGAIVSATYTA